jgi:GDP-6-deoxy-D-talose 4-dehydrogenase
MTRVLVTGINGFTGRYVAKKLAAQGHEVVGLVREGGVVPQQDGDDSWQTYAADLGNLERIQEVVAHAKPERVVHLAAISFVSHGDINEIYQANLIGTHNLLSALANEAPNIERVLLASSANIYGNQQGGQLGEGTVPRPSNHYGVSKLAMEHVARLMQNQLPIIVTRPFNYTGKGQSSNFIVPKIINHARMGKIDLELGNIDVARDFSDVRSVADIYARLLACPEAVGNTFNVCSGRAYALRDIISMIENLSGIRFNISVNPNFVRADEIRKLFGDPAKLESVIGQVDMPPLRDTLEWMLSE